MVKPTVAASQDYGATAIVLSPSCCRAAQANIAEATGLKAHGAPLHVAIEWAMGPNADPMVTRPAAQIVAWRSLWVSMDTAQKNEVRAMWPRLLLDMHRDRRWARVSGPASATIATLMDAKWIAPFPDRWMAPDHNHFHVLGESETDFSTFLDIFKHQLRLELWAIDLLHHDGSGGSSSITASSAEVLRAGKCAHRLLMKQGKNSEARALTSAVLNRAWTAQRKANTFANASPCCPRCGAAEETKLHRYWQCSTNDSLGDAVLKTNHWRSRAAAEREHANAWERAITPHEWLPRKSPPVKAETWTTSNWDEVASDPRVVMASDGSGGIASSTPALRHVGGGAAIRRPAGEGYEYAFLYATVPGRQTVPRAELHTAVQVLKRAPNHTVLPTLYIDASYVTKGCANGWGDKGGTNDDLWKDYWSLRARRGPVANVVKTKAHVVDLEEMVE